MKLLQQLGLDSANANSSRLMTCETCVCRLEQQLLQLSGQTTKQFNKEFLHIIVT
jgi:hypothetical protein